MELKFIWIKEYNIISETGFNFNNSENQFFEYENEKLTVSTIPKSVLNFGPKVVGVTAIAGANGSGKSSLCEAILESTATYVNGMFSSDENFKGIVCYDNYIFIQNSLKLVNKEELNHNFNIVEYEGSPFENIDMEFKTRAIKGGFIYYSNIVDQRGYNEQVNLANISTNHLLYQDPQYGTLNTIESQYSQIWKSELKNEMIHPIEAYYSEEGYRKTRFVVDNFEFIPFKIPRQIRFKATYYGNNSKLNKSILENEAAYNGFLNELFDSIGTYHFKRDLRSEPIKTDKEKYKEWIFKLFKLNIYLAVSIDHRRTIDEKALSDFYYNNIIDEGLFKNVGLITELISLFQDLISRCEHPDEISYAWIHHMYYENSEDWRFYILQYCWLPSTLENIQQLGKFMNIEEKLTNERNFFRRVMDYDNFGQLSGGQNSFLSLFGRMYDKLRNYNSGLDYRESLLVFIDEGEVGFHPKWKKNYFKWLMEFFNKDFHEFKIQLVLTSHSPYLLSDLAPNNILLLKKSLEDKTELVSTVNFNTFGANIHELLSDSFFLEDGLIGEFAKEQIQYVIDTLNDADPNNVGLVKSVKPIINVIGEPFLKSKLEEMYYSIIPEEYDKDKRREYLLNELKKLDN